MHALACHKQGGMKPLLYCVTLSMLLLTIKFTVKQYSCPDPAHMSIPKTDLLMFQLFMCIKLTDDRPPGPTLRPLFSKVMPAVSSVANPLCPEYRQFSFTKGQSQTNYQQLPLHS